MDNDNCPYSEYGHSWEAGMMHVHDEDVESTARARRAFGETVECGQCDHVYQVTP
jgi:hypothetical protein